MSFQGIGKSIVPIYSKPERGCSSPRSHRSDEFAAGYSLTGCSPAEPVSASPAGFIFSEPLGDVNRKRVPTLDFTMSVGANYN